MQNYNYFVKIFDLGLMPEQVLLHCGVTGEGENTRRKKFFWEGEGKKEKNDLDFLQLFN